MTHSSGVFARRVSFGKCALFAALFLFPFPQRSFSAPPPPHSSVHYSVKTIPLPGAAGPVFLDYLAYDPASRSLWVPAGDTGSVVIIDAATNHARHLDGFPVSHREVAGSSLPVGPSSVTIGESAVYVGSRADSRICSIGRSTFKLLQCIEFAPPSAGLTAAPDALIYVAATHELWVTTGIPPAGVPSADRSVQIFSVAQPGGLAPAGKIPLPASAEGYAMDNAHGRFYTNLRESGQTAVIDVRLRRVMNTWRSCDDPTGLAVDPRRNFLFVACGDRVLVLDLRHNGRLAASVPTGAGLDNIDYDDRSGTLFAAAGETGRLTLARVDNAGHPTILAVVPTARGARNVVAGPAGTAYIIDPLNARILKVQLQ